MLLFAYYFAQNREKFRPLLDINPILLIIISVLYSASVSINGVFTKLIVEPFKVFISLREGVFLAIISSVGNFFAPAGAGYGLRAVYLKKKHNLSYTNYSVTLAGYYVLIIMVNSLMGLLALLLLRKHDGSNYMLIFAALLGALLFSLIFSVFDLSEKHSPKTSNRILKKVFNFFIMISRGWKEISVNRSLMLRLIALTIFSLALNMGLVALIVVSLHFSTSVAAIMLYSVLGVLSMFFNITPGNIGIKEGITLFSAGVMGFSLNQVILIAIVERGVVFLSLIYLWVIAERMKRTLF